jgi:hypothetical protein
MKVAFGLFSLAALVKMAITAYSPRADVIGKEHIELGQITPPVAQQRMQYH